MHCKHGVPAQQTCIDCLADPELQIGAEVDAASATKIDGVVFLALRTLTPGEMRLCAAKLCVISSAHAESFDVLALVAALNTAYGR